MAAGRLLLAARGVELNARTLAGAMLEAETHLSIHAYFAALAKQSKE